MPGSSRGDDLLQLATDAIVRGRAAGTANGYSDGWDEGCFRYSGEGRVGDLDFVGGNAATDTR